MIYRNLLYNYIYCKIFSTLDASIQSLDLTVSLYHDAWIQLQALKATVIPRSNYFLNLTDMNSTLQLRLIYLNYVCSSM